MRVMTTTSALVAAAMTAQGFTVRCRNYRTGRYIPMQVLPTTLEQNDVFSIDYLNYTIVERKRKYRAYGLSAQYLHDKPSIIAENHTVYDVAITDSGSGWPPFELSVAELVYKNIAYELYS